MERGHIRLVGLQPRVTMKKKRPQTSVQQPKQTKKKGTKRDVLGGAIRTIPVPPRELDLDSPDSPLGRDLAPLALDDLQTPIERDARHPLLPTSKLRTCASSSKARDCIYVACYCSPAAACASVRRRSVLGTTERLWWRLERNRVLAAGKGGAEALERDVGRCAVR